MPHLIQRLSNWYFSRRVPTQFRQYDTREYIRISLKTDSYRQAKRLAAIENAKVEKQWAAFEHDQPLNDKRAFHQVTERAEALGFAYKPLEQLIIEPFEKELLQRLLFLAKQTIDEPKAEAVLGTANQPELHLKDVWTIFADLKRDVKLAKSHHQYNKWKYPRLQAITILNSLVSDKPIKELNRQDLKLVKDYWLNRIEKDGISPGTVNKQFVYLRTMFDAINDHYELGMDIDKLFRKQMLKERYQPRPPFTKDHILNVLLKAENLQGLKGEHQAMLYVLAETGISFDEQVKIQAEDIFLEAAIPHVIIRPSKKNELKTVHRKRIMPLVGFALEAFQKYPDGFSESVKIADHASFQIGRYLKENALLPTPEHSAYSLRHSFQDRLTNEDCPDRIQTDLMGHRFANRIKYGEGGSLEKKYEWLKRIQLKPVPKEISL